MKYIKLYENYHNVNLIVKFKDVDEYFRAAEFFKDESSFTPNDYDSEFLSISFSCADQDDADVTEHEIENELDENNFSGFYFESDSDLDEVNNSASDDLKSNFRSWEYDHDNETDAYGLYNILVQRHPQEDKDELKTLAFNWVGYNPDSDK